jgi:hypothetical protein
MFRIVKKERGYIVEIEVVKWTLFGLKKEWKPFVKSSGLDCAWHHKKYHSAHLNLITQIEDELILR